MNLTRNQWLGIAGVVLSAMVVSTAYFTDMFGAEVAKEIVGTAAFLNMILGGITTMLSGQSTQVKDVLAMPGVDKITVNAQANQTLAAIATDPTQLKIKPTDNAAVAVNQTAKG